MILYASPTYLVKKDLNDDEVVTKEEYAKFFAKRFQKVIQSSPKLEYDFNNDGTVSSFEESLRAIATRTIKTRDENKNGLLDGAEVSAALESYMGKSWYTYADLNSDGKITSRELAAAQWVHR